MTETESHTQGTPAEPPAPRGMDALPGLFEPGWWFLLAGIGALATAMLIPAAEDMADAVWQRNVVLAAERERADRLARHEAYLHALEQGDAGAIQQLRIMQLNEVPEGLEPLGEPRVDPGRASASVFAMLEPERTERPPPPAHHADRSRLAGWATGPRSRLWLIGGGCLCLLLGLAPVWSPSRPRSIVGSASRGGAATV
ncbi:MAG: hypothetical protein AAGB48_05470 [Planctomycetota bacterium]